MPLGEVQDPHSNLFLPLWEVACLAMESYLTIGDFSRATHLTVKALRHYHEIKLLVPSEVNAGTGHRYYTPEQIPIAQVIRRLRTLEMPLDDIRVVINSPNLATRNELVTDHLRHLEVELTRTQEAINTLRSILEPSNPKQMVEHRRVPSTSAAAITEIIDVKDATSWYQGALGEIFALLSVQKVAPTGPGAAIYANDLFESERGFATVFVPCEDPFRAMGRVAPIVVPETELAISVHQGPQNGMDRVYGSLAAHVADHALAVEGSIREYYLIGLRETPDESLWRTEVGWPIFYVAKGDT